MAIKSGALAALLATVCAACSAAEAPPVQAQGAASAAPVVLPAADAQSVKVVAAANAFLATLTPAQRQAAQYAFTDAAQRARWSNLPVMAVRRGGVAWGELDAPQRAALMDLLGAVLSPMGVKMVEEQMDADDVLRGDAGGRRGFGGGPSFGRDFYYVSFLGQPSATAPWMLQFGGHHLAINASVAGPNISLSPSLTGGQPTHYVREGKPVYIVETEVARSMAMLGSLTPAQRDKAIVSSQTVGLVLGPGHDGQTLQPEGLPGREMTDAQKDRLMALIEARLGILNADDLAATLEPVRKNLDRTHFAWFGPTVAGGAYFRVTGPTLILEFSPQDRGGVSEHLHNMYRDPTNEYGAAWAPLT